MAYMASSRGCINPAVVKYLKLLLEKEPYSNGKMTVLVYSNQRSTSSDHLALVNCFDSREPEEL